MTVKAPRKHHRTFSSVGVDGCRGGWFFVKVDPGGVFSWGVVVTGYEDRAEGVMEVNRDGSGQFRTVTLKPLVTITPESDPATAERMHREANARCFVARSVNFPVVHELRTTIS